MYKISSLLALIVLNQPVPLSSIKIASYNTYQIFTNNLSSKLLPQQIEQVGGSGLDVICLQELSLASTIQGYIDALQPYGYTNSFSVLDVLPSENLTPPRTPCSQELIDDLTTSQCAANCTPLYDGEIAYNYCLASLCPDDYNKLIYTECASCLLSYAAIQSQISSNPIYTLTLEGAFTFCKAPPTLPTDPPIVFSDNLFNFTDGATIVSKTEYPIINTWSYSLPSWLFVERRIQITEINICSETDPNNKRNDCSDAIIVGCTHLEPTAYISDSDIPQSPKLDDKNITSHIGLNRVQNEFILDNIYNDNILQILGREENKNNIFGVFLMGDLNVGQLFNRCDYMNDAGQVADNCKGENPSNPFDLYELEGFVDAPDIENGGDNSDIVCTACQNPESDDYNPLAVDPNGDRFINDPSSSRDLDHILVQDGYCENFKKTTFSREFMDRIVEGVIDGELVATSDHYGISLDIEFEVNKGGDIKYKKRKNL